MGRNFLQMLSAKQVEISSCKLAFHISCKIVTSFCWLIYLTLKVPITTAADDTFCDIFLNFRKKYGMIFHENCLPTDNSREISCLIFYFWKSSKIWNYRLLQIIGGALGVKSLRVNTSHASGVFCRLLKIFSNSLDQISIDRTSQRPEVTKLFSCPTQQSTKIQLHHKN